MALCFRAIRQLRHVRLPKQIGLNTWNNKAFRIVGSRPFSENYSLTNPKFTESKHVWFPTTTLRNFTSSTPEKNPPEETPQPKKTGIIQKFKEMYRDYWYVLIPVHVATSTVWAGVFYYTVRSGVDIIGILETLRISETLIGTLRDSKAGYVALTYALYKIATPLRYAVTVAGTTYAIRRLTAIGWIKPVPSRERIKEMIQEKRDNLQDRFTESKQHYKAQVEEKKAQVLEEMNRKKPSNEYKKNGLYK